MDSIDVTCPIDMFSNFKKGIQNFFHISRVRWKGQIEEFPMGHEQNIFCRYSIY